MDCEDARALWRAELASNPFEASGGRCRGWCKYWFAFYGCDGEEMNDADARAARVVELYHEAANEHEHSVAMMKLGLAYQYGRLEIQSGAGIQVEVDFAKSLKFYRRGADAGYYNATGILGQWHEDGSLGLAVNLAEAARLTWGFARAIVRR